MPDIYVALKPRGHMILPGTMIPAMLLVVLTSILAGIGRILLVPFYMRQRGYTLSDMGFASGSGMKLYNGYTTVIHRTRITASPTPKSNPHPGGHTAVLKRHTVMKTPHRRISEKNVASNLHKPQHPIPNPQR